MQLNQQDQDTYSIWMRRLREKPMNCSQKRKAAEEDIQQLKKYMFVHLWKRMLTSVLKRQKVSPEVKWHSSLANQKHCG